MTNDDTTKPVATDLTTTPGDAAPANFVAAVYARLPVPPMASANIEAWFTTMDFWFTASGINTDKQKTATVLATLDPNLVGQLLVIASMTQQDKYEFIKTKKMLPIPSILLGLRVAIKPDINASLTELVYGTTLRIPGEFFDTCPGPKEVSSDTVTQFQSAMQNLRPTQTAHHAATKTFVSKDFHIASHVFVRNNSIRPSLSNPYDGPYPVIRRTTKFFTVSVRGRKVNISLDRLKPAFYANEDSSNEMEVISSNQKILCIFRQSFSGIEENIVQ
ncbi:PREDICTED: uncharacterized protein LOC108362847 [Rhagoletis zephyria]|uniref:uncharacterized protein LOC108362847 n=1 Tax=Rhagoletis zephyria TaxID=28612 RepID=UPI000811A7E5|nr:PREDICTED: uncharacterized protein LOC108362847 [Rhagoletis zephyria]